MIFAVARNRVWNLSHDRAAMVLSFLVPIVFFSIFAAIFGRDSNRGTARPIAVAVVDEDGTDASRAFLAALRAEQGLTLITSPRTLAVSRSGAAPDARAYTAATAEAAVRAGDLSVALVLPEGFGSRPVRFGPAGERPGITMLADPSDPIGPALVGGMIQRAAAIALPDAVVRGSVDVVDRLSGGLSSDQKAAIETNLARLRQQRIPASVSSVTQEGPGLVTVARRDVVGQKKKSPMVAFYAAGIGVMFLLFSATGAGGAIIEEVESGTFDRILATRVTIGKLLAGKLVYLAGLAASQLLIMFVWGSIVFGLEMRGHWAGFAVMTIATALAASTFGLLLASVSRSRMQLVALSNMIVLAMSAVGGSMFPRFLMPEFLQKVGYVTLNAWAIDGFQKVFWRDEPVSNLWPQVLVLCLTAAIFFAIARRVARRWEAV